MMSCTTGNMSSGNMTMMNMAMCCTDGNGTGTPNHYLCNNMGANLNNGYYWDNFGSD